MAEATGCTRTWAFYRTELAGNWIVVATAQRHVCMLTSLQRITLIREAGIEYSDGLTFKSY